MSLDEKDCVPSVEGACREKGSERACLCPLLRLFLELTMLTRSMHAFSGLSLMEKDILKDWKARRALLLRLSLQILTA
jgi:succinate dehydrogenase hydrophobic anchor subunit